MTEEAQLKKKWLDLINWTYDTLKEMDHKDGGIKMCVSRVVPDNEKINNFLLIDVKDHLCAILTLDRGYEHKDVLCVNDFIKREEIDDDKILSHINRINVKMPCDKERNINKNEGKVLLLDMIAILIKLKILCSIKEASKFSVSFIELLSNCGIKYVGNYYGVNIDKKMLCFIDDVFYFLSVKYYSAFFIASCVNNHSTMDNILVPIGFKSIYEYSNISYSASHLDRKIYSLNYKDHGDTKQSRRVFNTF